jgi:hypothetical protein
MHVVSARLLKVAGALSVGSLGVLSGSSALVGAAPPGGPSATATSVVHVTQILSGASLHHAFMPPGTTTTRSESLSDPDDISRLGDDLFVGFQNGPQGQPSTDGNLDSTVVELTLNGTPVSQWDITGKADGVTADPATGLVVATVNEDANSALYTINPARGPAGVKRYAYNEPLPHGGGTDAISFYRGEMFISASAPGTTGAPAPQPTYPAVYSVTLDPSTLVATVTPLFNDEDPAIIANVNSSQHRQQVNLALTDPDSNEVVPPSAPRFGGDFMLTSQGDQEQIFVRDAGGPHQRLHVLTLSQSVDDTAWATGYGGRLYSTDSTNDAVDVVTGPFRTGQVLTVATPCGSNSAPAACPSLPMFPANYLATLNPWTGQVAAVTTTGAPYVPQGGLAFVANSYFPLKNADPVPTPSHPE